MTWIIIKEMIEVVRMQDFSFNREQVDEFYDEHVGKDFYEKHADYMMSGMCCALYLRGNNVVERVRELVGATNPKDALPETLRGQFGTGLPDNGFHSSESDESADREMYMVDHFFLENCDK